MNFHRDEMSGDELLCDGVLGWCKVKLGLSNFRSAPVIIIQKKYLIVKIKGIDYIHEVWL